MDTSGNVVFDYTVTGSPVTSIATGSILNGNADGYYTIISYLTAPASGTSFLLFSPNNETSTTNYGNLGFYISDTTVGNNSFTGGTLGGLQCCTCATGAGTVGFGAMTLYAKSGAPRLADITLLRSIVTTTINYMYVLGQVWNNSTDNITSGTFHCGGADIPVGSRVIILKGNSLTVGTSPGATGAWKRVGNVVLSSPSNSVTFNGLDGNTAVCYYLSLQYKATGDSGAQVRPNNSSIANTYGQQSMRAVNTNIYADRFATNRLLGSYNGTSSGAYSFLNMLMFAKTGFVRPAITQVIENVSGTTVTALAIFGEVWNETSTNITSLVVYTGNNFATGSQFDLYALYT